MGEETGQRGLPVPTQRAPIHRNWSSVAPQLAPLPRGRPLISDAVDTRGDTPRLLGCVFTKEVLWGD